MHFRQWRHNLFFIDDVIAVCPSKILNKMRKILQFGQEYINADVGVGGIS